MEILKPGKVEQREFVCPKCGCVFVASKCLDVRDGDCVACPQDACYHMLRWDDGESYEEPTHREGVSMGNEFKFYRHKICKDIYLAKCTHRTGEEPEEYYFATRYLPGAIRDASASGFENLMNKTRGEGEAELVAEMVDEKYVNIDGYKGTLKKKLTFKVSDFECVILKAKRLENGKENNYENSGTRQG